MKKLDVPGQIKSSSEQKKRIIWKNLPESVSLAKS